MATAARNAGWRGPSESLSAAPVRPVRIDVRTKQVYESLRGHSQAWTARERQLAERFPPALLLLEDLFCVLYAPGAKLDPETAPEFSWQFKTLASLWPLADFQKLREQTAHDAVAAAMAAWRLTDRLAQEALANSAVARRRWLRFPWVKERERGENDAAGQERQRLAAPAYAVVRAVQDVRGMADGDAALRRVWGIGPGKRSVHDVDDVWRLIEDVRALPDFDVLTEALEQFRRLLDPTVRRRQRRGGRGVVRLVGWEWGADPERAIAEEMARLADPDMQYLFFEAYEHRRLLQTRYEDDDSGPTGPIVCCVDVSRSMNTPAALGKERFLWAKAVALAIADAAKQMKRPFVGICFSSEHDVAEFRLPRGDGWAEEAVAMAACDFDGGTNFRAPLERALASVKQAPAKGGHIVFITDGEAALPDRFRRRFTQQKAELETRLITVFIDGRHEELASISDAVVDVSSQRRGSWETAVAGVGGLLTRRGRGSVTSGTRCDD